LYEKLNNMNVNHDICFNFKPIIQRVEEDVINMHNNKNKYILLLSYLLHLYTKVLTLSVEFF